MAQTDFVNEIGANWVGFVGEKYLVELEIDEFHHNPHGMVHGGVLCTLLDAAMGRAFYESIAAEKRSSVTLEIKVNFLKAARGRKLKAYGYLVNKTRRTGFVEGFIEDDEGQLIAKASSTMFVLQ